MSFDPDVLHVLCPKCGGTLTLQCGPEDPTAGAQEVVCPFCGHVQRWDVNAQVLWVTRGHGGPPRT